MWQLSYLLRRLVLGSLAPGREALACTFVGGALLIFFALAIGLVHIPGALFVPPPVLEERTLSDGTRLITQVVPGRVYRGLKLYIDGQWHGANCQPQHLCAGPALYYASKGKVTDRKVPLRVTYDPATVHRALFPSSVKVAAIHVAETGELLYADHRMDAQPATSSPAAE
jgi:hypothetical protein